MSDHHRKLEAMYLGGPINAFYRPTIAVSDGEAVIEMDVRPEFWHAASAMHGSVYFKLLDDAAFFKLPKPFLQSRSRQIHSSRQFGIRHACIRL